MTINKKLLELLCCPSCRAELEERADGAALECAGCRRVYPVVDGIPNLIVEEAGPPG